MTKADAVLSQEKLKLCRGLCIKLNDVHAPAAIQQPRLHTAKEFYTTSNQVLDASRSYKKRSKDVRLFFRH